MPWTLIVQPVRTTSQLFLDQGMYSSWPTPPNSLPAVRRLGWLAPTLFPKERISSSRLGSRLEARPTLFSPTALPEPYQEPTGLLAYIPACRPCMADVIRRLLTSGRPATHTHTQSALRIVSTTMRWRRWTHRSPILNAHRLREVCLVDLGDSSAAA